MAAMPTWVRAVIRMPTIVMTSITRDRPVAMAMSDQAPPVLLKIASTDGPRTSTPATAPMM
jgi:hypothetical protein